MGKKLIKTDFVITKDRVAQRIVLEILIDSVPGITIREAKDISRKVSVKISNALLEIKKGGLKLTDEQANSVDFWIDQIVNSARDFNQKN